MDCPGCRAMCSPGSQACRSCGLDFEKWIDSKWKKAVKHPRRSRPASRSLAKGAVFAACLLAVLALVRSAAPRPAPPPAPVSQPSLAVFWKDRDPASARLMRALTTVRGKFRSDELRMVAVCLDDLSEAQLARAARERDWTVPLTTAKSSPGLASLADGRGREVLIFDGKGKMEVVNLDGEDYQSEIELALWRALPKLRSAARSGLVTPVPGG